MSFHNFQHFEPINQFIKSSKQVIREFGYDDVILQNVQNYLEEGNKINEFEILNLKQDVDSEIKKIKEKQDDLLQIKEEMGNMLKLSNKKHVEINNEEEKEEIHKDDEKEIFDDKSTEIINNEEEKEIINEETILTFN
jgi:hypothetical protein